MEMVIFKVSAGAPLLRSLFATAMTLMDIDGFSSPIFELPLRSEGRTLSISQGL